MANILERIQLLAERECSTVAALERSIGASKGVLYRAISNGTDIQSKWLLAIVENFPLVSAEWLLTGRGSMYVEEGAQSSAASPAAPLPTETQAPDPVPAGGDGYLRELLATEKQEKARLLSLMESQQRTIEALAEASKKMGAPTAEGAACADAG